MKISMRKITWMSIGFALAMLTAALLVVPLILCFLIGFALLIEGLSTPACPSTRQERAAQEKHYAEYYALDPYTRIHG